jgi:hypothetical protein
MRNNSNLGAYLLIGTGVYFLALKFGWVPHLGYLIMEWWPVILIVAGVVMLVRDRTGNGRK